MFVISCHSDTNFVSHSLKRVDNELYFGHMDNFVGVHSVMEAYFSGNLNQDYVRIELTYGEEENFAGTHEVLETLMPSDMVIVVDVTATETQKDFVIEKCKSQKVKEFILSKLEKQSFDLYEDCPDPVADEDETDVYREKCEYTFFLGIPCFGGDYNEEPVYCRVKSIEKVAEAVCKLALHYPEFCQKYQINPEKTIDRPKRVSGERKYKPELNRIIQANQQVKLYRPLMETDAIGYPLDINDFLILVAEVSEFCLDGYSILRLEDISDIRSNEYERFRERVMQEKGIVVSKPDDIDISSWRTIFNQFLKTNEVIIIEYELSEREEFLIGRVSNLRDEWVEIFHINSLAEIAGEPTEISFEDITRVQFREDYTSTYDKYTVTKTA